VGESGPGRRVECPLSVLAGQRGMVGDHEDRCVGRMGQVVQEVDDGLPGL
jgi:hypothetical protein